MTNLDQFESAFKSAAKPRFADEDVQLTSVLIVTDLDRDGAEAFGEAARLFLATVVADTTPAWHVITGDQYDTVGGLLRLVDERDPDIVCSYRNLHAAATEYPYSLGTNIDVLTQATETPVLLLPHPRLSSDGEREPKTAATVMAITDHLTGDHHLVSIAARLTQPHGQLWLTHVEDELTFRRYMETISKISTIDTESAEEAILRQLLKEPHDYILSCREVLQAKADRFPIEIKELVTLGHHLKDYQRMVEEHHVDLLVMNTKDEDQLAMHGVAYPLSIQLRHVPLLLL